MQVVVGDLFSGMVGSELQLQLSIAMCPVWTVVRVLWQYLKAVQGGIRKSYFQSRGILQLLNSNDEEDILKIQNANTKSVDLWCVNSTIFPVRFLVLMELIITPVYSAGKCILSRPSILTSTQQN
jgi:hypothetical protein